MKIKTLIVAVLIALCLFAVPVAAEGESATVTVPELGLEMEIPEEYDYVFTRDMSEDDPAFAELGLAKEQLFASDTVYFEALTEHRGAEIIVTKSRNDWSEMYYDFNDLSDEELLGLADLCMENDSSDVEMEYTDYGLFDGNEDVRFLKAVGSFESEGLSGTTIQYVTVYNGDTYTFTFNFIGVNLSDTEITMTEEVISSAVFPDLQPRDEENSNMFFIIIIVVLLVVIGLLLSVIRKQKYTVKNLNEEWTDDKKTEE